MRQLLSTCGDYHLAGLDKSAFLFSTTCNTLCELSSPAPEKETENNNNSEGLNEIQAVEIHKCSTNSDEYWCAVSLGDKRLAIYRWNSKESKDQLESRLVYHAPKRAVHMCFATLPGKDPSGPLCLVAGDLAGDAYAYSLEEKKSKLLLGHTASMLTGISVLENRILTADRDEKVRVSSFPQSYLVLGYLLGHTQYITSIDSMKMNNGLRVVATCGGDSTIRLWDLESLQQLSELECPKAEDDSSLIPIKIVLNPKGTMAAVIYDKSTRLDVYMIEESQDNKSATLGELAHTADCATFLLSICFQDSDTLLTLSKEPNYIIAYKITDNDMTFMEDATSILCRKASEGKIKLPETILERDNYQNIKLKKLNETRGPSGEEAPWNRIERVDIARERQKRHKKRKIEKKIEVKNRERAEESKDA